MFSLFEGKSNVKTFNQVNTIAKPNNCLPYVQQDPSTGKEIAINILKLTEIQKHVFTRAGTTQLTPIEFPLTKIYYT